MNGWAQPLTVVACMLVILGVGYFLGVFWTWRRVHEGVANRGRLANNPEVRRLALRQQKNLTKLRQEQFTRNDAERDTIMTGEAWVAREEGNEGEPTRISNSGL